MTVQLVFDKTAFFGFGGGASAIEDSLDSTEEFVTTADVLYVDPTSLTTAGTQAGYFLYLAPLALSDSSRDTRDFVPAMWESYQWGGGRWALPLSGDVLLLTYLAQHPNQMLSRGQILDVVWGYENSPDTDQVVTVNTRRLREKIELNPSDPSLVLTVPGIGYKLVN